MLDTLKELGAWDLVAWMAPKTTNNLKGNIVEDWLDFIRFVNRFHGKIPKVAEFGDL